MSEKCGSLPPWWEINSFPSVCEEKPVEKKAKRITFSVEVGANCGVVVGGYVKPMVRFEVDELTPQLRVKLIEAAGQVAAAAYDAMERQEAIRLNHQPEAV